MKIICLRTGKTLEKNLTITTAGEAMVKRIRAQCESDNWKPENTDSLVSQYRLNGKNPFMFDVRP